MKKVSIPPVARFPTRTPLESNSKDRHTPEYIEYLKSSEWRDKRKKVLSKCNHCRLCWTKKVLQIHHLHYKTLFNENLDKDVVVLCKFCHEFIHAEFLVRKHLSQTLEVFTMRKIHRWPLGKWNRKGKVSKRKKRKPRGKKPQVVIHKSPLNKSLSNWNSEKKKFEYVPYINKKKLKMNDIIKLHWLKVALKEDRPKRETIAQRLARLKREANLPS